MHSAREASFLPTMSASSLESFMGLVSPDPLGILSWWFLLVASVSEKKIEGGQTLTEGVYGVSPH